MTSLRPPGGLQGDGCLRRGRGGCQLVRRGRPAWRGGAGSGVRVGRGWGRAPGRDGGGRLQPTGQRGPGPPGLGPGRGGGAGPPARRRGALPANRATRQPGRTSRIGHGHYRKIDIITPKTRSAPKFAGPGRAPGARPRRAAPANRAAGARAAGARAGPRGWGRTPGATAGGDSSQPGNGATWARLPAGAKGLAPAPTG